MKKFDQFFTLVRNQFEYGGKKYAHSGEKESTDVLFDDFGKNWLFGTIAKYCKRYSNLARERDLLKIACYMFILWLKRGYHLDKEGVEEPINTTVEVKSKYFSLFQKRVEYFYTCYNCSQNPMLKIYANLHTYADVPFTWVSEQGLFEIFVLAYMVWDKEIEQKGTDEDVYNEKRSKS